MALRPLNPSYFDYNAIIRRSMTDRSKQESTAKLPPSLTQHGGGRGPVFDSKACVDFEFDIAIARLREIVAVIIFLQVGKHDS